MRVMLSVLFLFVVGAQPMGIGQGGQKKAPIMKRDLPFIACQTCKELIHYSYDGVHELRLESKPGKPVRESDIYGLLESVCDPETDEGEWIGTFDLVESGSELKLVNQNTIGFCETECRTIARACSDLIEEFDYSLAEALFANDANEEQLFQRFCYKVSNVCAKPTPPLPKDRPEGPPFIPMTEDDYKMKKMMEQMKSMGLGGQVFDQDSAREFIAEHYNDGDEDDDIEVEKAEKTESETTTTVKEQNQFQQMVKTAYEKANEGYQVVESMMKRFYKRMTSGSSTKEAEL